MPDSSPSPKPRLAPRDHRVQALPNGRGTLHPPRSAPGAGTCSEAYVAGTRATIPPPLLRTDSIPPGGEEARDAHRCVPV